MEKSDFHILFQKDGLSKALLG